MYTNPAVYRVNKKEDIGDETPKMDLSMLILPRLIVAVLLDIIAVSIPYWFGIAPNVHGMWKECPSKCPEELITTRALHMFALLVGVGALIFYIVTGVKEIITMKMRRIVGSALCLVAGAFILIADCYIGSKVPLNAVCFSISLIAAYLFTVVGGILSTLVPSE